MLEISINKKLKDTLSPLAIGWVSAGVRAAKQSHELWREINSHLAHLTSTMTAEAIAAVPEIAAIRVAYKALGKDPSHSRGSAEALLRRVLSWLLRALERDELFLTAKRLFAEWPKWPESRVKVRFLLYRSIGRVTTKKRLVILHAIS